MGSNAFITFYVGKNGILQTPSLAMCVHSAIMRHDLTLISNVRMRRHNDTDTTPWRGTFCAGIASLILYIIITKRKVSHYRTVESLRV